MNETAGEWGQGAHIKTRVSYGGYIHNVAWVDNVFYTAGSPGGALVIESGYQSSGQCNATTCTEVKDIVFRNLTVVHGSSGSINCYPARPCVNITFDGVHMQVRVLVLKKIARPCSMVGLRSHTPSPDFFRCMSCINRMAAPGVVKMWHLLLSTM